MGSGQFVSEQVAKSIGCDIGNARNPGNPCQQAIRSVRNRLDGQHAVNEANLGECVSRWRTEHEMWSNHARTGAKV